MSKTLGGISPAPGEETIITGDAGVISVQIIGTDGFPSGAPIVLAQSHGFEGGTFFSVNVDVDSFSATQLATGGFELVYNETVSDVQGFTHREMVGIGVDAAGHLVTDPAVSTADGLSPGNLHIQLDTPQGRLSGATPTDPQVYTLSGGRYAVVYDTFDANNLATSHVALAGPAGVSSDTVTQGRPDLVGGSLGDVVLIYQTPTGDPDHPVLISHEVLNDDGTVLASRGLSNDYILSTGGFIATPGFDAAHDTITVADPHGGSTSGPATTLTFDARDHTLTFDLDSDGPSAPVVLTTIDATSLSAANLTYHPEVLKNIALDGSSTIEWFDSQNDQPWQTLFATETPTGAVKTYDVEADDGTKTHWVFDADNSQAYTRYVDQEDAAGRVHQHSVVLDDGESWVANFQYSGSQVVQYTIDSFDAQGHQVGHGLYSPDGTLIV